MRLVDQYPMRQPRTVADHCDLRKNVSEVIELFQMRKLRQVKDDAAVRIPQQPRQLMRLGRRIIAAGHQHPGQPLQAGIIAFRVNDAQTVAMQDQLLTH